MLRKVSYIELLALINSGGTAAVYFGVDTRGPNLGMPLAVKELDSKYLNDPQVMALFKSEANLYLSLEHPNIVKLKNLLLLPEGAFLVMEYVEGHNLREYIKLHHGQLPFHTAALFISEVCDAMSYAHDQEVVHLDIKPSNIMYSNDNEIKLIDFGISVRGSEILKNPIMGTPYYMSPEQIRGSEIDKRTDIYSIGVTLFELVTGRPPFSAHNTRDEIFEMGKFQKLPIVKPFFTYDLPLVDLMNTVIQRATAKNADDRYQSCEEMGADLTLILDA